MPAAAAAVGTAGTAGITVVVAATVVVATVVVATAVVVAAARPTAIGTEYNNTWGLRWWASSQVFFCLLRHRTE